MVVAGTQDAVLMVESEAQELTEDQMLGAVLFAHEEFQVVINAIKELAAEAGKPTWDWQPEAENTALLTAIRSQFGAAISEAYTITIKLDRYARLGEIREQAVAALASQVEDEGPTAAEVKEALVKLNTVSCVRILLTVNHVLMVATIAQCVHWRLKWAYWIKPTAQPCSPVVKPKL